MKSHRFNYQTASDCISGRYVRAVRNARPSPAPVPSQFGASLRALWSCLACASRPLLFALAAVSGAVAVFLVSQL
jgi:hypothetical protein